MNLDVVPDEKLKEIYALQNAKVHMEHEISLCLTFIMCMTGLSRVRITV